MNTKKINPVPLREIVIALAVGLISVLITVLVEETYTPAQTITKMKLFWGMLNMVPFVIAFYVKHYGHEINFFAYYLTVFVQWFLLTLFFLKLKGLVRGRKGFWDNQT